MSITVSCECGRKLKAKDASAGKKVRCPACDRLLLVPTSAEADEGEEVIGLAEKIRHCPKCKKEVDRGAVLCINCGYNFKTGKSLKTKFKPNTVSTRASLDFGLWKFFGLFDFLRLLGTFEQIDITRAEDGELRLTTKLRFFFIPVWSWEFDLKSFTTVLTDVTLGKGGVGLVRILARLIFWYVSLDQYALYLNGPRMKKPLRIWHGVNQSEMHELVEMFKAKGLSVERK